MDGSVVTDEMRALVGTWHGETYAGGEVHAEDIRKFAGAIGDTNPLWQDVDHALSTDRGGIVASPTFVDRFTPFYVLAGDNAQGYIGGPMPVQTPFKHGFSAGDEYEVLRPVRPGDYITVTTTISDIFEKQSRPGIGRMLFIRYDKTYRNQRNEVVTICHWTSVSYEGPVDADESDEPVLTAASEKTIREAALPATASNGIDEATTPVYIEDVSEGFLLTPLKRLQTQKRFVRYAQASNDLSEIHYNYTLVRERGMPDVVGQGALTSGYIGSMVTNWCTPNGVLKNLKVQYRHFTLPGDVVTTGGVVTGTREVDGEHLVNCDVWAENQHGRKVTLGTAVVSLPSRAA